MLSFKDQDLEGYVWTNLCYFNCFMKLYIVEHSRKKKKTSQQLFFLWVDDWNTGVVYLATYTLVGNLKNKNKNVVEFIFVSFVTTVVMMQRDIRKTFSAHLFMIT